MKAFGEKLSKLFDAALLYGDDCATADTSENEQSVENALTLDKMLEAIRAVAIIYYTESQWVQRGAAYYVESKSFDINLPDGSAVPFVNYPGFLIINPIDLETCRQRYPLYRFISLKEWKPA